jgi:hypothetical protein
MVQSNLIELTCFADTLTFLTGLTDWRGGTCENTLSITLMSTKGLTLVIFDVDAIFAVY